METQEILKKQTQELLDRMVDGTQVEVEKEEDMYHIHIQAGEEAPTVIGRHGETIRALQKILEVIVFKENQERVNLLINVNDYREKQIERLEYIANQSVEKVKERNSSTYLRGFSSYERRIMHEYISKNFPELTSYSVGEGRDRRMVIDVQKEGQENSQSEEMNNEPRQEKMQDDIVDVSDLIEE